MKQRMELVSLVEAGVPIGEAASLFSVSRKTARKWCERFAARGIEGLADEARAPRTHPNATPEAIQAELLIGALVVVLAKLIEGALLTAHRGVRRARGVVLERAVHPFVTAVGLRLPSGEIHWKRRRIFVSEVLGGEPLGLEEVADAIWRVSFSAIPLGFLLDRQPELGLVPPNSSKLPQGMEPMSPVQM